jgi:hypothetical protein
MDSSVKSELKKIQKPFRQGIQIDRAFLGTVMSERFLGTRGIVPKNVLTLIADTETALSPLANLEFSTG